MNRRIRYWAAKGGTIRVAKERSARLLEADGAFIRSRQLERLNAVWEDAWQNVRYYANLKREYDLPDRFDSMAQFSESVPVLRRKELQRNEDLFRRSNGMPDSWLRTGGTTGEPLRVRAWKREGAVSRANFLIARAWYGVVPGDKLFLVWGHSHLLGSGWQRLINCTKRRVKDLLLGYYRANAYSLDEDSLAAMAEAYTRHRPDYVVGYSGALALLARHVRGRSEFRPKVVIGCGEPFPEGDSRQRVSECFQAPVSMEYGSLECGLVAHEHPQGGYRVFWDTHLAEAERESQDVGTLLVTKLVRGYTPLIRYEIGDRAVLDGGADGPLVRFAAVAGRTDDVIPTVYRSAIGLAVSRIPSVLQYQLVMRNGRPFEVRLRMDRDMTAEDEKLIRRTIGGANSDLAELRFVQVRDVAKTMAGKTLSWVEE